MIAQTTNMTPTPSTGDIWEWVGDDPAIILLMNCISKDSGYWQALNLTAGDVEDIRFDDANIVNWRFLA